MRDPEALGIALTDDALREEASRHAGVWPKYVHLSDVYDYAERRGLFDSVPIYSGGPPDHAKLRQQELEDRAANGDRFAAALLAGDTLAEDPVD